MDLSEQNHQVTINILDHSTRQGTHVYLIELLEGEQLIIGGVTVESITELSGKEVFDRAVRQYFIPLLRGDK